MATIKQQISLSEKRRQRAMALQPQVQTSMPQVYDETTTQGQVYSTRQQLQQAKTPLQQFKSQYLFPKKRERAFTDRRARAQVVQAGQGVAEQLGQIQQQEQTFEREVATKAPEYALQAQKQQALMEAKQNIQNRINDLQARIQKRQEYILRKQQDRSDKNRREDINDAEDDIDVYNAELREYQKAMGLAETDLIKQHFSGYIKQKAQYEADYTEARNRQEADFRKMKEDPKSDYSKIMEDLKKAGINIGTNPSLSQFKQGINKFNSDIAYKNQLLKFAEQKGGVQFLNPEQQKALGAFDQNQSIKQWESQNPGERVVYDKIGNPIGISSSVYQKTFSIDEYNKLAQSVSTPIKPINTYMPAPTFRDKYRSAVGEAGYVKGTLSFLGSQAAEKSDMARQWFINKGLTNYDPRVSPIVGGVVQNVPYLVPYLGASLLVAGGGESFATSAGRQRLSQQSLSWQDKGFSPIIAKTFAYGAPVLEIGLGGLGLASQVSALRTSQTQKMVEKATLQKIAGYRIEGKVGGIDLIKGYARADPNWFQRNILRLKPVKIATILEQPYYTTTGGRVVLEGGKGYSVAKQGGRTTITLFDTAGTAQRGTGVLWVGGGNKLRVMAKTDMEAGFGRLILKTRGQSTGKIVKFYDPLRNKFIYTYSGKIQKLNDIKRTSFIGGTSEKDGILNIISGRPSKLRLNLISGETAIRGSPGIIGRIKIIKRKPEADFFSIAGGSSGGRTNLVTKQSQATASYAGELSSMLVKSSSRVAPQITPTSSLNVLPSLLTGGQSQKVEVVQKTRQSRNLNQLIIQPQKIETRIRSATSQRVQQIQRENQQQRQRSIQRLQQINQTRQQQRVKQIQSTQLRLQQKTISLQLLTPISSVPAVSPRPVAPPFFLIPQGKKEKPRERTQPIPVSRPQRYNILPTITQQIYRVRRKGGKVKRPTGFELIRV